MQIREVRVMKLQAPWVEAPKLQRPRENAHVGTPTWERPHGKTR